MNNKAKVGQRIRLTQSAMESSILRPNVERLGLSGEGVILDEPTVSVFYWVRFDADNQKGAFCLNIREEEFDVIEDVVTLRLDSETLDFLRRDFSVANDDAISGALRAMDVRK